MSGTGNAEAWGLPRVLDFFEARRATTDEVYPSEWFFLRDRLRDGMTVLDVGCAQGGFARVLGEHLGAFSYTGVDINADMVARARAKHPGHAFHHVAEGDLAVLGERRFDLVIVLGILHLHEAWRDTLAAAWRHTGGCLVFDLRETHLPTIEDKARSYFRMDFHGGGPEHAETTLPYNVVNAGEALAVVTETCRGAARISHYGYLHAVSPAAVCPLDEVMANTYCVER